MWGNCFLWAIPKWLKGYFQGKSLVIRKSLISWVPHAMIVDCVDGMEIEEHIPVHFAVPQNKFLAKIPIHTIIFRGKIRRGKAICFCPSCIETMEEIKCNCPECRKERENAES